MRFTAHVTRIVISLSLMLLPALCFAYDPDEVAARDTVKNLVAAHSETKSGAFNPGEMIIEHISDNHEWHVYGKFFIPLPVIVKTDKGFEMFSSGNFRNPVTKELQPYKGKNYTYALKEGKIVVWDEGMNTENETATKTVLDVSITKNVVTLFIVVALMLLIFTNVAKTYRKRVGQTTKGMQSLFEPLIVLWFVP